MGRRGQLGKAVASTSITGVQAGKPQEQLARFSQLWPELDTAGTALSSPPRPPALRYRSPPPGAFVLTCPHTCSRTSLGSHDLPPPAQDPQMKPHVPAKPSPLPQGSVPRVINLRPTPPSLRPCREHHDPIRKQRWLTGLEPLLSACVSTANSLHSLNATNPRQRHGEPLVFRGLQQHLPPSPTPVLLQTP
ncbi:unnamed protein product [Rangifer tarandus platyrhynchus]|uniref:Uncharacterized protein n=1 Tax=Rangifer tarandus platyrhynchus TaxID=3082113 RepID=A0AC59ZPV4_RANTA